jgi:hypothetical protein
MELITSKMNLSKGKHFYALKIEDIMQFSAVAFIFSLNLHFLDICKCSDSIFKVSDTYVCYVNYVLFFMLSDESELVPSRPST